MTKKRNQEGIAVLAVLGIVVVVVAVGAAGYYVYQRQSTKSDAEQSVQDNAEFQKTYEKGSADYEQRVQQSEASSQ